MKFQESNIIRQIDLQSYKRKSQTHSDFSNLIENKDKSNKVNKEYYKNKDDTKLTWAFDKFNFNTKKHRSSSNQSLLKERYNYNPILHKFEKNCFYDKFF